MSNEGPPRRRSRSFVLDTNHAHAIDTNHARAIDIDEGMRSLIRGAADRVHACRLVLLCALLDDPSGRAALISRRTDFTPQELAVALLATLVGREAEIVDTLNAPPPLISGALAAFDSAIDELARLGVSFAEEVVAKHQQVSEHVLDRAAGYGLLMAATHFEQRPPRQFAPFVRWWVGMAIASERARDIGLSPAAQPTLACVELTPSASRPTLRIDLNSGDT